jgi:hypothetical protein
MASLSLTAPDSFGFAKGATLYGCVINGFNAGSLAATIGNANAQTSFYVGATVPTPMTGLKVGVSYDYAGVNHQGALLASTYQNDVALYTSFQATEKLSLHVRGEYFWQSRVGSPLVNGAATTPVGNQTAVIPPKVFGLTGTVQYDLWKNVLSRLEVRWDHAAAGSDAYGQQIGNPSLIGDKKNAVLVAANMIYKF